MPLDVLLTTKHSLDVCAKRLDAVEKLFCDGLTRYREKMINIYQAAAYTASNRVIFLSKVAHAEESLTPAR